MSIGTTAARTTAVAFLAAGFASLGSTVGTAGAGPPVFSAQHRGNAELRAPRAHAQAVGAIAAAPLSGGTVAVGSQPQASALDPVTRTLYVANGPDGTISVINAAKCNAYLAAGCRRQPPTVTVGGFAADVAVNVATDTVYVANGAGDTVSVIDGATCNALHTSGCDQTPATVTVGGGPVALDLDAATDTVYVANFGSSAHGKTISVLNTSQCDANITSGCGTAVVASVKIGAAPDGVIVDQAMDEVYAATVAPSGAEALWLIDGTTCNAADTTGCGGRPASVALGNGTGDADVGLAIDQASRTLYVTNYNDNTVSMIDVATCGQVRHTGCSTPPPVAQVGSGPTGIAVDPAAHTIFVSNQGDNTYSVLDANRCNAPNGGCTSVRSRSRRTGRSPIGVTYDGATGTVYIPNADDGTVSVLKSAACNASRGVGCTEFPPTFATGGGPNGVITDHPLHTLYLLQSGDNDIAVLAEQTCNDMVASGCTHPVATIAVGNAAQRGTALDERTGTIYVPNFLDETVSVIDTLTCNAATQSGCSSAPPTLAVPAPPIAVAVDDATDSVYVATFKGTVAVFDGATCNATDQSGCGQTAASVKVGRGDVNDVVVDPAANTIYSADQGGGSAPPGHTLSVIDGRTCNGTDHSGCGERPPTVNVPVGPTGSPSTRARTRSTTRHTAIRRTPGSGRAQGTACR